MRFIHTVVSSWQDDVARHEEEEEQQQEQEQEQEEQEEEQQQEEEQEEQEEEEQEQQEQEEALLHFNFAVEYLTQRAVIVLWKAEKQQDFRIETNF